MSRVNEQFTEAIKKLAKNLERTKLKVQSKFDEVDANIGTQNDKIQAIQMKMSGPQEVDTSLYDASIKELTDKISELESTINILQKDLISIKKAHVELLKQSNIEEEEPKPTGSISPEIIESMKDTIQTTEELPETPPVVDIPTAKPKSSIPVPDKPSTPDLTAIPSARPSEEVVVETPEKKPDKSIPKPRDGPLIPEAPKSKYDHPDEEKPAKTVLPELPGAEKPKKTGKTKKKDEYLEVLKKLDSI